jgi:hypothetical protein
MKGIWWDLVIIKINCHGICIYNDEKGKEHYTW